MQVPHAEQPTLMPYYDALNRLVSGKPEIVAPGTKITLNSVAIEAGRSPGSIKKSRTVFEALIREIQVRAREQQERIRPGIPQVLQAKDKAAKARARADNYEFKYKEALARELMLLIAWDEATKALRKAGKVVSFTSTPRP